MQAFAVEHDALRHLRHPVADGQELLELLLVLDDEETALRVRQQVRDLLGAVGGVDAGDDAADALDAEVGVDPLLAILGEDRDYLPPLQPERREPQADGAGGVEEGRPRVTLPDAERLLAVRGALAESADNGAGRASTRVSQPSRRYGGPEGPESSLAAWTS